MSTSYLGILFCALLYSVQCLEWYDSKVLYQVYTKSFADSNGDGVGDLNGIKSKAQYFKDIGVGAVWLTPIFESPLENDGYDISNFTNINNIFGTLGDFKELVKALHDVGVKILLDFIPNHTSDEHPWFKDSLNRKNDKDDYYVWVTPDKKGPDGSWMPPNNWLSIVGGSAWTFRHERQQFYLHQFGSYEPDLNYSNPKVVTEIKNVLKFWMDLGVDGFKVDTVPYLVEDKDLNIESPIPGCSDVDSYDCYVHNMTKDLPESILVINELSTVFDEDKYKGQPRKFFLQCPTTTKNAVKYYSKHSTLLNLNLLSLQRDSNATFIEQIIKEWTDMVPTGNTTLWVMGNQDHSRVGSKMGEDMIDAMNMLVFLAPGNTNTYYGEEIGMVDSVSSFTNADDYRTPMQWSNGPNAGFTSGTPWIPINPNYWYVNKEKESTDAKSHLTVYKDLVKLQDEIVDNSTYSTHVLSPWIFTLMRSGYMLIINLDNRDQKVNLSRIENVPSDITVRIASTNSAIKDGTKIKSEDVSMRPRSGIIFTVGNSVFRNTASCLILFGMLILGSFL